MLPSSRRLLVRTRDVVRERIDGRWHATHVLDTAGPDRAATLSRKEGIRRAKVEDDARDRVLLSMPYSRRSACREPVSEACQRVGDG